jgi:pyruvate-formate lyase
MNLARRFSLINGGRDEISGKQVAPNAGDAREILDYDEVVESSIAR